MKIFKKAALIVLTATTLSSACEAAVLTSKNIHDSVCKSVAQQVKNSVKGDVSVQVNSIPYDNINIPDGDVKINAVLNYQNFTPATVARVEIYVNEKRVDTFGVPVRIKVTDNVWVAKDKINLGDSLTSSKLALEKRDVSVLADKAARQDYDTDNSLSKRVFREGDIIDIRYLEKLPDVRRNTQVNVLFNSEYVNVTMPAVALENGKEGDFIRVKSLKYKKEYTGKVINRNTVLVNI